MTAGDRAAEAARPTARSVETGRPTAIDLCAECFPKWLLWLSYRLPPRHEFVLIGRDNVKRRRELAETRFQEWRAVVHEQQDFIVRMCWKKHGSAMQLSLDLPA